MQLTSFPVELIREIADHLPTKDIASLTATSKLLRNVLADHLYRKARHFKRDTHESLTDRLREVSFFDKDGNGTVLEWAAIYDRFKIFKRLLTEPGVDVVLRDSYGVTLLHRLAAQGMVRFMEPLISRLRQDGYDLSSVDLSALTPLHFAAGRDMIEAVKLLITSGADVSPKDHHGNTPLHIAAVNGSYNVLPILINAGVDVNSEARFGWTAIDHLIAVQKLLLLGSRPTAWQGRPHALKEYVYLSPRPLNCYFGESENVGSFG